jgi:hypothetical protein
MENDDGDCTSPRYQRFNYPPSEQLRASLGILGIVSQPTTPRTNFAEPNDFFGSESVHTRRDPYTRRFFSSLKTERTARKTYRTPTRSTDDRA